MAAPHNPHRGATWTPQLDADLAELWAVPGYSCHDIGQIMGRTHRAIAARAAVIGLAIKVRGTPRKGPDTFWTDERVETLKTLWAEGKSGSEIARLMGGVSRNAVIGKIFRMGHTGRERPAKPVTRIRVVGAPKINFRKAAKVRLEGPSRVKLETVTQDMRAKAWMPLEGSTPRVWTERVFGECRWPIDVPDAEMHACCLPTKQHPNYCPAHRAMATVRKTETVTTKGKGWIEMRRAA